MKATTVPLHSATRKLAGYAASLAVATLCLASPATAAMIFESGTLGPTGLEQGTVDATNINGSVFTGVRFQLTQPAITTQIGGHFVDRNNGTFFGAIVALDDESDFPDSGDLSTDDVLGSTELTFPVPSAEVFGDLNLALEPGWYALVFGSGLLGTNGNGAATRNNSDVGDPVYIGWQNGEGWLNITTLSTIFVDHHFIVKGIAVPESSTTALFLTFSLVYASKRNRACGIF